MPVATRFRAIAYDKIGQGYTDNPARDDDYTIGRVVEHAAGFIAKLGLPRFMWSATPEAVTRLRA